MKKQLTLVFTLFCFSILVINPFITGKAQSKIIVPVDYPTITGTVPPDSETFPPQISIETPTNNTAYSTNSLPLIFNVTAPQSKTASEATVLFVTYQGDWMDKGVQLQFTGGGGQSCYSLVISKIPEGNHRITIQAFGSGLYLENAQYLSYKEFRINSQSQANFIIDTETPTSSILEIQNVSTSQEIFLAFTVNEPILTASYSLDGQQNITMQGNTTLPNLPAGQHNVTIYTYDLAGNIGKSESTFFVTQQPEPIQSEPLPVIGISIIIAGVIFMLASFYLTYRRHRKTANSVKKL